MIGYAQSVRKGIWGQRKIEGPTVDKEDRKGNPRRRCFSQEGVRYTKSQGKSVSRGGDGKDEFSRHGRALWLACSRHCLKASGDGWQVVMGTEAQEGGC